METNTVILSVQDYNELRDFKKKIESDYSFNTSTIYPGKVRYTIHSNWVTNSDVIKELTETNKILKEKIYSLENTVTVRITFWKIIKWKISKLLFNK